MKLNLTKFPLMGDQTTQQLFQVFEEVGIQARFVGGCVRDAVLGIDAHDIDIAVPISPDEIIHVLSTAKIHTIPTGYEFGTITAVIDGRPFQITSLRKDWETDGRHPRVTYGTDWKEDAARRDFTMNALYADKEGVIYDYFKGIEDLKAGTVHFVGDAHQRIEEDYLRILRYFRFLAWYGHGPLHEEAIEACTALSAGLNGLSRERVGHEFLKLLAAPQPCLSLKLMDHCGVSPFILPHPMNLQALETILNFEESSTPLCRLATLSLPQIDDKGLAKALRLSGKQKQYLHGCANRLEDYPSSERTIYRNLYQDGVAFFKDLTILSLALRSLSSTPSILQAAFRIAASWKSPSFPLKGQDLIEMGMKAGPELGTLLKDCENWWINQGFQPDREACLSWVKEKKGHNT
ncbi:MAG: CCA tRNA nucleotidyltransferase [Candidatus Paracaedibacter sp.]